MVFVSILQSAILHTYCNAFNHPLMNFRRVIAHGLTDAQQQRTTDRHFLPVFSLRGEVDYEGHDAIQHLHPATFRRFLCFMLKPKIMQCRTENQPVSSWSLDAFEFRFMLIRPMRSIGWRIAGVNFTSAMMVRSICRTHGNVVSRQSYRLWTDAESASEAAAH